MDRAGRVATVDFVGAGSTSTGLDIVLVSCERWPGTSDGDRLLASELTGRGHRVRTLPWNVAPVAEFTAADLVLLRSNWDFHHDLEGFDRWLTQLEDARVALHNSIALVRWNLKKSYLQDLIDAGFRAPQTLITSALDDPTVADWIDDHGFDRVVIKPAWGASGHGVQLVPRGGLATAAAHWRTETDRRPMLVQEFMPGVADGEQALVYFNGDFSHGFLRTAADGDFRVNGRYGGTSAALTDVTPAAIEFGAKVLTTLPELPTYARVDVVTDGDDYALMELEVNEPALGLDLAPGSAARFADALLGQATSPR